MIAGRLPAANGTGQWLRCDGLLDVSDDASFADYTRRARPERLVAHGSARARRVARRPPRRRPEGLPALVGAELPGSVTVDC